MEKAVIADLVRGDNLHNDVLNKAGFMIEVINETDVRVCTVSGEAVWHIDQCFTVDNL